MITIVSILIVVGTLATRPVTYFRDSGPSQPHPRGGVTGFIGRVLKNILGLVLIILGFVLSLPGVPGQGVLTILIGLVLVDFPGKRRFEQKLVARPGGTRDDESRARLPRQAAAGALRPLTIASGLLQRHVQTLHAGPGQQRWRPT